VLLRRNEELRRNMSSTYRQFGLTSSLTGGVEDVIKEADSTLDDVLTK